MRNDRAFQDPRLAHAELLALYDRETGRLRDAFRAFVAGTLPPGITTNASASSASMYIFDQNPTNALATGDQQTFNVTVSSNALAQPLRVTLAWTDPPGDPVAATKLVNDLNLVVTNLNDPTNPIVYYGNDIPASSTFNSARSTNTPPNYDSVNNIENVYLPAGAGTKTGCRPVSAACAA